AGALGGDRHRTELERPREQLRAVGPLQPDAAAHAGNRIDDQPDAHRAAPSLRSSAATSSIACRAILTSSATSSSVITNGGENETVSEAGSARVSMPSSRQRRVTRAATLSAG